MELKYGLQTFSEIGIIKITPEYVNLTTYSETSKRFELYKLENNRASFSVKTETKNKNIVSLITSGIDTVEICGIKAEPVVKEKENDIMSEYSDNSYIKYLSIGPKNVKIDLDVDTEQISVVCNHTVEFCIPESGLSESDGMKYLDNDIAQWKTLYSIERKNTVKLLHPDGVILQGDVYVQTHGGYKGRGISSVNHELIPAYEIQIFELDY